MTDVAAAAPIDGPLSVEAATDLLRSVPTEQVELPTEEQPAGAEPAAEEPIEASTESEADLAAEGELGAETPTEEAPVEQPEPVVPAIEAPHFWDAEAKARFKDIPPELQPIVAEQARVQVAAAAKAIEESAQARKAAEGQASQVTQLAEHLNVVLPKAMKTFGDRWSTIDWQSLAKDDPARYVAEKAEFDAQKEQVQQLEQAAGEANRLQHQTFVRAEAETLSKLATADIAPELADPATAPAAKMAIANYLVSTGIPGEALGRISAAETLIAYKAWKWDLAQEAAKKAQTLTRAAPKPAAAPKPQAIPATRTAPAVKPTAAAPLAPSRARNVDTARARLNASGSVDDAVALLKIMKG